MATESQSSAPLSRSRGMPGASVRARGMSRALSPFLVMIFISGWVFGAIFSPSFLEGPLSGLLLILLAGGLLFTWQRAVMLMERYEEGAQGEEIVARTLASLSEDWRVFHGVPWSGKELDHLVLGLDHLFVVETVQWSGTVGLVDGALTHGEERYEGYTLEALRNRAAQVAEALNLPHTSVTPVVCIVEGRFVDAVGEHEGVWLTELQGLIPVLRENHRGGIGAAQKVEVISMLNDWLEKERAG